MEAIKPQTCIPPALFAASRKQAEIKKWDGSGRADIGWDGLRKDSDLWSSDGDCLIYFYHKGTSKRGPSLCVPYSAVKAVGCDASFLVDIHANSTRPGSFYASSDDSSNDNSPVCGENKIELFLGAPSSERNQKLNWHITTRNFFAWLFGEALVGEDLGQAMEQLLERLWLYRGKGYDNIHDTLQYAKDLGYLEFVDRPAHALAMLSFAETHQIHSLYMDAFAHCVGMKDRLDTFGGFRHITRLTKALLSRAHLEMDLHIERATLSIGNFMEEELSPAHLGLTRGARVHLDRFRSFLHIYCVAKQGYWPRLNDGTFPRNLYQSLQHDFQALYDYLADKEIGKDCQIPPSAAGGLCVLQNIEAFNARHNYLALPFSTPLSPLVSGLDDLSYAQRSRRPSWFGFGNNNQHHIDSQRVQTIRDALSSATNSGDAAAFSCPLVHDYIHFESEEGITVDEDVSVTDARKVRWILTYAMLQTLSSITHAPVEVTKAAETPYPLCCLTTGTPPWKSSSTTVKLPKSTTSLDRCSTIDDLSPPVTSVRPDCESYDYFHYLPTSKLGHVHTVSTPINIFYRRPSFTSSKSIQLLLRRSSFRDSTMGPASPPAIPARRRDIQGSKIPVKHSYVAPHPATTLRLPWIETSNNSSTTIPALDWGSDPNDRTDTSSDDDNSSSDVDTLSHTPSLDPYQQHHAVPFNAKADQELSQTRVRNSLDTIFDTLLEDFTSYPGSTL